MPVPASSGLPLLLFAVQLLSTLAMFGLIWFVQLVHYPLFLRIGPEHFVAYERHHADRTGYIAGSLMLAELLSSVCLLSAALRPRQITPLTAWIGLAAVLLLWASTALVQIPLHRRLHAGFDRSSIHRLIRTNWLRTCLWTVRALLVTWWAVRR